MLLGLITVLSLGTRAAAQCDPLEDPCCWDPCMCDPCCWDYCSVSCNPGAPDCNGNGRSDYCDLQGGGYDCDWNGVIDSCELANGTAADCNGDGVIDSCGDPGTDCNGNGLPDACDIAAGIAEDCNQNGLIDGCEKQAWIHVETLPIGPIGVGFSHSFTFEDLPPVLGYGPSELSVDVHGDFDSPAEVLFVHVIAPGGDPPGINDYWGYYAPPPPSGDFGSSACAGGGGILSDLSQGFGFELGQTAPGGTLTGEVSTSIAVDPLLCQGDTWVVIRLRYFAATSADCNANGLLDSCEIAAGYTADVNNNGIPDSCDQPLTNCTGDFNVSQSVDGLDLALLMSDWGTSAASRDLDQDGTIGGADVAILFAHWGNCDQ